MIEKCTLIDFVDLNLDEKKMILSWRNDSRIRKWMYSQEEISLANHLVFIETLKNNENKKYFVVKQDEEYIGVIDFVNISKQSADMGIYANPKKIGVGKLLLELIIEYGFNSLKTKKIVAEVFCENKRAYDLYKSLGFKDFLQKIVDDRDVYCLELEDENR